MEIDIYQIIGYSASVIIAISMMMNSFVKFRIINLIGATVFSTYGFLIGAIPVGCLNGLIMIVDIYYLYKIFSKKEVFETLEVRPDNKYLLRFLEFHNKEIQKFFPGFVYQPEVNTISFFVLRNTAVAGIFLAHRENVTELKVGLDYVIPQFRDFKNGKYIYWRLKDYFIKQGFTRVKADGNSKKYIRYLKKLGFKESAGGDYYMDLVKIE